MTAKTTENFDIPLAKGNEVLVPKIKYYTIDGYVIVLKSSIILRRTVK